MRTHMNDIITIVCAANENYSLGLAVTVRSLLAHLAQGQAIKIIILDTGICDNTRKKLMTSWQHPLAEILFQSIDLTPISELPLSRNMQSSVYAPLIIADLLPDDRVLYLDADLIIHTDITPLWNTYIGPYPIGAVQDISVDATYCNTGVLLMNLAMWRREELSTQCINYAKHNPESIQWWDQDVINTILKDRWFALDQRWNVATESCMISGWIPIEEQRPFVEQLIQDARITHCLGKQKPWKYQSKHPKTPLFFEYLERTAWAGWLPDPSSHIPHKLWTLQTATSSSL
jgi:lipopolysaccharide biosynthesis glycosyltransferase